MGGGGNEGVDLEDRRLNERLKQVLSDLGEHPQLSIPAACGGHVETVAAYRFFDNEKVTAERILQPHFERTRERIAEQPVVLLVQDTSEMDVTRPQQQVRGAGPLDGGSRRGFFLIRWRPLRRAACRWVPSPPRYGPAGNLVGAFPSGTTACGEPSRSRRKRVFAGWKD